VFIDNFGQRPEPSFSIITQFQPLLYYSCIFWHKYLTWDLLIYVFLGLPPHSSTLAWKIPWMEEPGRLQSMGSLRVGHDWATSLWLFTFMHWRRKWQPTPVFLPGESQGQGSLMGCRPWGCTESDRTTTTINYLQMRKLKLRVVSCLAQAYIARN